MAKECRIKAACVCGAVFGIAGSTAICEAAYMAWLEKHDVCVKMWQRANAPVQHEIETVPQQLPKRGIGE